MVLMECPVYHHLGLAKHLGLVSRYHTHPAGFRVLKWLVGVAPALHMHRIRCSSKNFLWECFLSVADF